MLLAARRRQDGARGGLCRAASRRGADSDSGRARPHRNSRHRAGRSPSTAAQRRRARARRPSPPCCRRRAAVSNATTERRRRTRQGTSGETWGRDRRRRSPGHRPRHRSRSRPRLGQRSREPRFADARLAGDQHHPPFAALRLLPAADKQLEFLVTTDERRCPRARRSDRRPRRSRWRCRRTRRCSRAGNRPTASISPTSKPLAAITRSAMSSVLSSSPAAVRSAPRQSRDNSFRAKLAAIGVNDTAVNLRNKVARGRFSATFLVQCLTAIGARALRLSEDIDGQ
jgi:hypothetical protein